MSSIAWNASPGPTLGIEWELQLVDRDTRLLRQEAAAVLAELSRLDGGGPGARVHHEFMLSTVEVVTGICATVGEAQRDLAATISQLQRITDERGIILACAGTHPVSDWREAQTTPHQRYAELLENLQWPARRIQTFGVHVHVGLRDGNRAIPIVNALAAYLPHFLGLTASSPFWGGEDTGLASSRAMVFGGLPTSGPPQQLSDWAGFEQYMDALLRAGTIGGIKEVWWDIRPHPDFGTIEVRIFDGVPTLRETGMAAALAQCLVHLLDTQLDRGYTLPRRPPWVIRDNKWRATRYGLDAMVITDDDGKTAPLRDQLRELIPELEPFADRLGCRDQLDVAYDVLDAGASYDRQRAVVARGGQLTDVVDALAAEFAANRFAGPEEAADGRV